jgi:hypothetical protein
MGASLAVQATAAAAAGVVGGATTRALTGQEQTAGDIVQDAAIGLATFGIVRGGSTVVNALRGGGSSAASSGARTAAGSGTRAATTTGSRATTGSTTSTSARGTTASTTRATSRLNPRAATGDAVEASRPTAPASPGTRATTSSGSRTATTDVAEGIRPSAPSSPQVVPQPAPSASTSQVSSQVATSVGGPNTPVYRIGEGVRRSVAARELGQPDVLAQVMGSGEAPSHVPLAQLLSPKATLPRDPRFLNVLRGVAEGATPPIEIIPIPPGSSQGLTPVLQVQLLRWRGPL